MRSFQSDFPFFGGSSPERSRLKNGDLLSVFDGFFDRLFGFEVTSGVHGFDVESW